MDNISQMQKEDARADVIQNKSVLSGTHFRQRVRRCFMNGKPCIFGNQERSAPLSDENSAKSNSVSNVFIVMPFRPNLDTFYEWSLKSYLIKGLGIDESTIKRADEFSNVGYVMCEKICRRIQEADLIVVDLSLDNSNVFYELGLSVGLNKQILLTCDEQKFKERNNIFWSSLGIGVKDPRRVDQIAVQYPNVGYINGENQRIRDRIYRVPLESLKPELKIIPLLIPEELPDETNDDIKVTFEGALKAALGVAINNMKNVADNPAGVNEALEIFDKQIHDLWEDQTSDPFIFQKDSPKIPKSFEEISNKINSAFTCIIDLAGEKAHSYFWLGYCHARGINVIPIYRSLKGQEASDPTKEKNQPLTLKENGDNDEKSIKNKTRDHILAFDIRALWYIDFREIRVPKLADLLKGVLEELIARDVPRRERNIFWERLTREKKVHIFTGAVHHEELNREVVGDWDLRTVSELVNYLSSSNESVLPELEKPIYAPETIRRKQKNLGTPWDDQSLSKFLDNVREQMAEKNSLIIASPDVNPLTEVCLAEVYGVPKLSYQGNSTNINEEFPNDRTIVALKDMSQETPHPGPGEISEQQEAPDAKGQDPESISPSFSRSHKDIAPGHRGFLVGVNNIIQEKYRSQDGAAAKGALEVFSVLAHLLIMKNPFSKVKDDTIIVLLNGVSGPGTFGLAEVLTGGTNEKKASKSEQILKRINEKWASESVKPEFKGIEAIIKVRIEPETTKTEELFSDVRSITDWEIWKSSEGKKISITNGNPRSILLQVLEPVS